METAKASTVAPTVTGEMTAQQMDVDCTPQYPQNPSMVQTPPKNAGMESVEPVSVVKAPSPEGSTHAPCMEIRTALPEVVPPAGLEGPGTGAIQKPQATSSPGVAMVDDPLSAAPLSTPVPSTVPTACQEGPNRDTMKCASDAVPAAVAEGLSNDEAQRSKSTHEPQLALHPVPSSALPSSTAPSEDVGAAVVEAPAAKLETHMVAPEPSVVAEPAAAPLPTLPPIEAPVATEAQAALVDSLAPPEPMTPHAPPPPAKHMARECTTSALCLEGTPLPSTPTPPPPPVRPAATQDTEVASSHGTPAPSTPKPPPPPARQAAAQDMEHGGSQGTPAPSTPKPPPPPTRPALAQDIEGTGSRGTPAPSTPKPPPPPPRPTGMRGSEVAGPQGTPAPSTPKPPASRRQVQAVEASPQSPAPGQRGTQPAVEAISPQSEASVKRKRKTRSQSSESNKSSESSQGKSPRASSHWAPSPIRDLSPKVHATQAASSGATPAALPKSKVAKGPRTTGGPRCSLSWFPPPPPSPKRSASKPPQRGVSVPRLPDAATAYEGSRRSRSNRRWAPAQEKEDEGRACSRFAAQGRRDRSYSRPHKSRKTNRSDSGSEDRRGRRSGVEDCASDRQLSKGGKAKGKGKNMSKGKESHSARGERARGDRRSRSTIPRRRRTSRNHRRRQRASSSSSSSSSASSRRTRSTSECQPRAKSTRFRARSRSERRARTPQRSASTRDQDKSHEEQAVRIQSRALSTAVSAVEIPVQAPPRMDEALLCFRQYLWAHVAEPASPDKAVQQYRKYENSYRKHHAVIYFNNHKSDGIIYEQYHPSFLTRMFDLRFLNARCAAEAVVAEVQAGTYKELSLTSLSSTHDSSPIDRDQLVRKCEIGGHGMAPHFPFDPDVCTLAFEGVPAALSVWSFLEVLGKCEGFVNLFLAPTKVGVLERMGHARFQSSENLEIACTKLSGVTIHECGYILQPKRVRPRSSHLVGVVPAIMSEPEQIEKDCKLAAELITTWNATKGLPQQPIQKMLASVENEGSAAKLDLCILYLRRVHHICYYSATACSDERELVESCGVARLRAHPSLVGGNPQEAKWATEHEARVRLLLQKGCQAKRPEICYSVEEEPLQSRWSKQCQEDTLEVEEAKFRCKRCQKLFRGPEFVHKHLLRAHPELQKKLINDINEESAREAFLADANAIKSVPLPSFPSSNSVLATRTIATPVRRRPGKWDQ